MWKLEVQKDNNGKEVGIGGLAVGWLKEYSVNGQPINFPGTRTQVSALLDMQHGQLLVDYLNGDWGKIGSAMQELREQPYMDMVRVPRAGG